MQRHFFLLIASLFLFDVRRTSAANWAVLVAGSNGWYNYRHQADLCHAYQILHQNGIPDSNIIVMMYDDLAQNPQYVTKDSFARETSNDLFISLFIEEIPPKV